MKKSLVLVGFLAAAATAGAGTRYSSYVTVGSTYAWGGMGDARRSSDAYQYIGCSISASASLRYATCFARDASGRYGTCRTYDDRLIRAVETVGSDSVIEFHWSDTTCTYINVMNDSRYAPRQP